MRSTRMMSFAGVIGAASLAAVSEMMPGAESEPGSARNRPSGSKPVSGGGARERARRMARLPDCRNCDGKGYEADYVGLEMKCVQVDCASCGGTGKQAQ